MTPSTRLKVWDGPVRVLHWALVAGLLAAWVTSQRWTRFHEAAGYAVLGIATARVLWGFVGSHYARFAQFVRPPRSTWAYVVQWRERREPRYIGHNPLGGWMVVALLSWVLATAFSGWLYTTDRFWGDDAMALIHEVLAWSLPALVVLHVLGVRFAGKRHRENLVRSMFDGCKRAPQERDVG